MVHIPDAMKKATFSEKSGNYFTPASRMMYANVFQPTFPGQDETDEMKKQWQITALIPAGYDLSVLEKAVADLIDKEHKPANEALRRKIKTPILETAAINSLASLAEEYPYCIRLTAKAFDKNGKRRQAPGVVDSRGGDVSEANEADETYNGRWFRASLNPYAWSHPTGGKGVSFGLVNVQLLSHDDPLAGGKVKASNEFDAIDDAELADLEEEFK
jgi:hypothetical protein